jgi:amidohydrolase
MHPELSFKEEQTSLYVQEFLKGLGVSFTTGWAGYGIVGIIEGQHPDRAVVALRADMDALPIQEENTVPYKSVHPGVMHACGHDVHTASLLGAASILQEIRSQFTGTVKLIFQPAEEKLPGGASIMIEEGVLKSPQPKTILGQHVHPQLPAGTVGFRSGQAMGSSDEITLKIIGKGGHGAMPHLAIDPVAIAAQVITALQQVASRSADPIMPSVLTFGSVHSDGGAFNVIPESVTLAGTFRTFDETWRQQAHTRITSIASDICSGFGAKCEIHIEKGYPSLTNHPEFTARCQANAVEYLGKASVVDIPSRLTSEDFAYYTQHLPGCFYRLGVANPDKGITSPVHSPYFDIDESALTIGAGLMAWLAVSELGL